MKERSQDQWRTKESDRARVCVCVCIHMCLSLVLFGDVAGQLKLRLPFVLCKLYMNMNGKCRIFYNIKIRRTVLKT